MAELRGGSSVGGYLLWHQGNINKSEFAPASHDHTFASLQSKPTTLSGFGITDAYTKTNLQTTGQASVHWGNLTNVPTTFTPSTHDHDSRYYTETEINNMLTGKSNTDHTHTFLSITDKPNTLSGFGITDAYTKLEVDNKISALVSSAPETLDTLKELAAALGDDPNFATTITTEVGKKAYSTDVYTKVNLQTSGQASVHWNNVSSKPTSFTPATHNHDDRYYTEDESDLRYVQMASVASTTAPTNKKVLWVDLNS